MAEPQPGLTAGVPGAGDHLGSSGWILDVEREFGRGTQLAEQLLQGGDVVGEVLTTDLGDRSTPGPPTDDAVVVQHRASVGGDPHIALETLGPEAESEPERVEGVLPLEGAGTAMGESDGRTGGGEPCHPQSLPDRDPLPVPRRFTGRSGRR